MHYYDDDEACRTLTSRDLVTASTERKIGDVHVLSMVNHGLDEYHTSDLSKCGGHEISVRKLGVFRSLIFEREFYFESLLDGSKSSRVLLRTRNANVALS